jgi:hypothetical protein
MIPDSIAQVEWIPCLEVKGLDLGSSLLSLQELTFGWKIWPIFVNCTVSDCGKLSSVSRKEKGMSIRVRISTFRRFEKELAKNL